MKKTYKIEVDCANCALKMETLAKKEAGGKDVQISFMSQRMTVEFLDGADEQTVMNSILKRCKKVERDAFIYF